MGCYTSVPQDRVEIIEKFGKFEKIAKPGFTCLPIPGIWTVSGSLSTRIRQISVSVETKTKDNVFVRVTVAVQFVVLEDEQSVYDAFYKLANPAHQIHSYVEDVVRGAVPALDVDRVFLEKKHIAESIFRNLDQEMRSFGYRIVATLVTDIEPDSHVKYEMNEINVNRRLRVANAERAEAAKIIQIKNAEAQAEATFLAGEGIARQRRAIVDGMKDSIDAFAGDIPGVSKKDVMDLMLLSQYCDTLKDIGKNGPCDVVFSPKKFRKESQVRSHPEVSRQRLPGRLSGPPTPRDRV